MQIYSDQQEELNYSQVLHASKVLSFPLPSLQGPPHPVTVKEPLTLGQCWQKEMSLPTLEVNQ